MGIDCEKLKYLLNNMEYHIGQLIDKLYIGCCSSFGYN